MVYSVTVEKVLDLRNQKPVDMTVKIQAGDQASAMVGAASQLRALGFAVEASCTVHVEADK